MDLDRWIERVYSERDIGRGIATSIAGAAGLVTYLVWKDAVIAVFVAVILFPVGRILGSELHSSWNRSQARRRGTRDLEDAFNELGSKERSVVDAFVQHGGSVITWRECNALPGFSHTGIEALRSRDLVTVGVMADGMTETFVLDQRFFDYAQRTTRAQSTE